MNTPSGSDPLYVFDKSLGAPFVSSIAKDIVLTLFTCGIYNLFIQYRQINALNFMLGTQKYEFGMWLLLTLVTCGLYNVYHEYRMSVDLGRIKNPNQPDTSEPIICVILSLFGLAIIANAIQQSAINEILGDTLV
jgi:hypothetical protein